MVESPLINVSWLLMELDSLKSYNLCHRVLFIHNGYFFVYMV